MTEAAKEAARDIMERIVALDWAENGSAERAITAMILSQRAEERKLCAIVCTNYDFFKKRETGTGSQDALNIAESLKAMDTPG